MKYEQQLLEHYHKSLVAALRACHKFAAAEEYSQGVSTYGGRRGCWQGESGSVAG